MIAKPLAPRASLGVLFAATLWIDLLWPILLLAGIEHVRIAPGITAFTPLDFYDYPITHSLLAVLGWSIAAGIVYYIFRKSMRESVVVGALVLSHWVLDFLTHRPDLPLWPNGPKVGLGLWSSVPATIAVEGSLFVAGLAVYLRTTRARDRIGSVALWALVIFLGLVYAANVFSPPPPDVRSIGWVGLALWLFVPWGWWIDKHRVSSRQ